MRCWVFTVNNPSESAQELVERVGANTGVRYCVCQLEQGLHGTVHLQGYLEFGDSVRFNHVRDIMVHDGLAAHVEARRGTREQAREYCLKDDTRVPGEEPAEYGDFVSRGQGRRSDIDDAVDCIKSGCTTKELAESHSVAFVKFHRGFSVLKSTIQPSRSAALGVRVLLLIGPTGTGKTRYVFERHADVYSKPGGSWYDGYDGQDVCLFDDYSGDLPLAHLLQVLDRYPLTVPVKGSFVTWMPSLIYLTSNVHPRNWYNWSKEGEMRYCALMRRISEVKVFATLGGIPDVVGPSQYGGIVECDGVRTYGHECEFLDQERVW